MSDRQLRSDLIRLAASSTPEVKEALLPLLAKTAAPKPSAKGKKTPVPNQDMRKAYYTMGDGHQALKRAIEDPPFRGDAVLAQRVAAITDAVGALHKHLEATYLWD